MNYMLLTVLLLIGVCAMLPHDEALAQDAAKPFLHPLFTDNMVLQRDIPARIWGWTQPGQEVTVTIEETAVNATVAEDGKWMATVGPFAAGGPYAVTITGPESVTLSNVMMGDVWICSGQSNMQWGMWGVVNAQEEIAAANYPGIRLFTVPNIVAFEPEDTVNGSWQECNPQTIGGFTAVGFFFGRHLHQELGVPIGLINSSWGGTIAEAWVSGAALKTMPDFNQAVTDLEQVAKVASEGDYDFDREMTAWWEKNDPGLQDAVGWGDAAFAPDSWQTMALPQNWEGAGLADFDGIVWFRREFDAPEALVGKDLTLHLGPIDDRDATWLNGVRLGGLNDWQAPRDYQVPAGALKAGRNVIAVQVLDTGGAGGFHGAPADMKLSVSGDADATPIALSGDWLYRVSQPLSETAAAPQPLQSNPNVPTVLYNAMIAPLTPAAIKGAIWYQGESNAGRHEQYSRLLPTLIKDWRARFSGGEFPFLIVQLANYMAVDEQPRDDAWPRLRDAQLQTVETVPNTGLAVAIDIGEADDIHPTNKQDVGLRLALPALALGHGQDIEYSGPVYRALTVEGDKARVSFDHLGGGLVAKGAEEVTGFAVAGADNRFVWAKAAIDGDTVLVWSPEVVRPVTVRYAWANNPVCNLYNQAGLPAVPFTSDR